MEMHFLWPKFWRLGNYYEENDTFSEQIDIRPPTTDRNNEQDAFFPFLHLSGRRILEL